MSSFLKSILQGQGQHKAARHDARHQVVKLTANMRAYLSVRACRISEGVSLHAMGPEAVGPQ